MFGLKTLCTPCTNTMFYMNSCWTLTFLLERGLIPALVLPFQPESVYNRRIISVNKWLNIILSSCPRARTRAHAHAHTRKPAHARLTILPVVPPDWFPIWTNRTTFSLLPLFGLNPKCTLDLPLGASTSPLISVIKLVILQECQPQPVKSLGRLWPSLGRPHSLAPQSVHQILGLREDAPLGSVDRARSPIYTLCELWPEFTYWPQFGTSRSHHKSISHIGVSTHTFT